MFKKSVIAGVLLATASSAHAVLPSLLGAPSAPQLSVLGTYVSGAALDAGAQEIGAFDAASQRLFVTNASANTVDILDLSDPAAPTLVDTIAADSVVLGGGVNSVAVKDGIVAVAIEAAVKQDPGTVAFFDASGTLLSAVTVGALPDMVTFSPNGRWALVANEGEPNDDYTVDPEGSVSIIDMSAGAANVEQADVRTAGFTRFNNRRLRGVRIFGPNATVAQDLEPEYIAVSADSRRAWVSLQENNALAIIDIPTARVLTVRTLGYKDHSKPGNGFDASNRDGAINIQPWPVLGMYQPDAIASFQVFGIDFLVTANEGDARDYAGYSEEERVKGLTLDDMSYPDAAELQQDAMLGRLNSTTATGDFDGDGDTDQIYAYGARSFSIRTRTGRLIYDSGDSIEQHIASVNPDFFNANNDENDSFDARSDDKGPEPEGVTTGKVGFRTYAFIGLERVGGVYVVDVSLPWRPKFVQYINNRDFTVPDSELGVNAAAAGDLGPEGLLFIPAADSPNGDALLVVTNEISGTTTVYSFK